MTPEWLYTSYERDSDAQQYVALARELVAQGEPRAAATVYDRAFGIAPGDQEIAVARRALLDQLAVTEHGMVFRYIPAGTFLMGSEHGDPDEAPAHPVRLGEYWLAETPVSWAGYCALMGWEPPPVGVPNDFHQRFEAATVAELKNWFFSVGAINRIRLQYCEDETTGAHDWHAHFPDDTLTDGDEKQKRLRELFGTVPREHPEQPWDYDQKPMVAVAWDQAVALADRISTAQVA